MGTWYEIERENVFFEENHKDIFAMVDWNATFFTELLILLVKWRPFSLAKTIILWTKSSPFNYNYDTLKLKIETGWEKHDLGKRKRHERKSRK